MTLEAWVNPSTVNSNWRDVIYKGNDNYWLEATSSSGSKPAAGATLGSSDVDTLGTAALKTNTWAFLTETYNGSTSTLALYVNGTLVSSLGIRGTSRPRPTRCRSAATASTASTSKGRSTRSASTMGR